MKPDEYYQKQIDHYTARLKQIKKRRNLITLAKLLTFLTSSTCHPKIIFK